MAKYRKFSEEEDRQFWRNNYIIEASYFVQSLEAGKKKKKTGAENVYANKNRANQGYRKSWRRLS